MRHVVICALVAITATIGLGEYWSAQASERGLESILGDFKGMYDLGWDGGVNSTLGYWYNEMSHQYFAQGCA